MKLETIKNNLHWLFYLFFVVKILYYLNFPQSLIIQHLFKAMDCHNTGINSNFTTDKLNYFSLSFIIINSNCDLDIYLTKYRLGFI